MPASPNRGSRRQKRAAASIAGPREAMDAEIIRRRRRLAPRLAQDFVRQLVADHEGQLVVGGGELDDPGHRRVPAGAERSRHDGARVRTISRGVLHHEA